MSANNIRLNLLLLVSVLMTGCGKGPKLPPTVPVTGTVTYNGNPLEGATVTLIPKDVQSGKTATGTSDSQGKFELETFIAGATKAKGAMVGDYQVTVAKMTGGTSMAMPDFTGGADNTPPTSSPTLPSTTVGGPRGAAEPPKSAIPAQYGDPQKSQLTASIKPSGNELTFELQGG